MPVWVFSSVEWEGGWHSIVPSVAAEVADGRKKFDFYDVWILVGKDDALHD